MTVREPLAPPPLLASTGAITRWAAIHDIGEVVARGAALGIDGIEVMIFTPFRERLDGVAEDFVRHGQTHGIGFPATHAEKDIGPEIARDDDAEAVQNALDRFSANCRFTQAIGGDRTVLHLWGLPESDRVMDRALAMLPELIDRAAEHDVMLGVESIPCLVDDPLANLQRVLEHDPRARVTLDTEFLAMHGQVPLVRDAAWLWQSDAVVHVHIKDFVDPSHIQPGQRRYLQPGEGEIDFPAWFAGLAANRYGGAICLEAPAPTPDGDVDTDRLRTSIASLRERIATAWSIQD
ncbi:MAG: sugar phosphate isomerase/epimerase family protein [Thermomicrobiales bacterium]